MLFSVKFLKDSAERALSTVAQTYAACAVVFGWIFDFQAFKAALGAGVLSLAKSIAGSKVGDPGSASLVKGS